MRRLEPAVEPLCPTISRVGEGPVWVALEQELWWVDLPHGDWHRWSWKTGAVETGHVADRVMFVLPGAADPIAAVAKGLAPVGRDGASVPQVGVEEGIEGTFVNDGKAGPDGRIYLGTFDRTRRPDRCGLYRVDEDLSAHRVAGDVTIGNGLDWSPDGATLYLVDSHRQVIWAYAFDPDSGTVGRRRPLASTAGFPGMPDGLCVDAEGTVWVALYGGWRLLRYDAAGRLRQEVKLPVELPASCAFAGPDLDALVVTTGYSRIVDRGERPGPLDGAVLRVETEAGGKGANECRIVMVAEPAGGSVEGHLP